MSPSDYSEDALIQKTTADFFADDLGWRSVTAYNTETYGPKGTLGRTDQTEVVLTRDLNAALRTLNPGLPDAAYDQAVDALTVTRATKTLFQINRELSALIKGRVPVTFKDADGKTRTERLRVLDFDEPENNDFLVVRELWVQGKVYRRRADLVGFVNGLPLLFIELKRSDKDDAGVVDWQTMLRGVCDKGHFLDIVENFIHFDDSPSGGSVKALAANHQYLGVNLAFAAVQAREVREGKLGVFWHTQGSGKSYSMLWLAQKVHRKLPGSFTFLIVTDRDELDQQIVKTFVGCGAVTEAKAPVVHASSRRDLKKLLAEDHRYIFTLIHKFDVNDMAPATLRDNVIVIADEAHRTQNGNLAETMRLVLPNAAFIAFTGTPLMKDDDDQLTRATFGEYVSRYDFKRAVDDGATVKLFYDNRGEKLALVDASINERIAKELGAHDLDLDQTERLKRDLARDYHILTSEERLDRIARDLCAHYATRWQTGKAMLVCLDKITAVRMYDLVEKHWAEETGRQELRVQEAREGRDDMIANPPNASDEDSPHERTCTLPPST